MRIKMSLGISALLLFAPLLAVAAEGDGALSFGAAQVSLGNVPAPSPSCAVCGLSLIAGSSGPQIATLGRDAFAVCIRDGEKVAVEIPVSNLAAGTKVQAEIMPTKTGAAQAGLSFDATPALQPLSEGKALLLETTVDAAAAEGRLRLLTIAGSGESVVRWRKIRFIQGQDIRPVPAMPEPSPETLPPPTLPELRPGMERVLIEWDWRMRDGIETEREPMPFARAIARTLKQGNDLASALNRNGVALDELLASWHALEQEFVAFAASPPPDGDARWEDLWLRVHEARRRIVFANPLLHTGPLVFAKHVPSSFSHQLTQYYGRCARPGGGLFVLEKPGESMTCRTLVCSELPPGSFMHPEVTYDGSRILFAYCDTPSVSNWGSNIEEFRGRHYHLYEIHADGSGLRQMTDGAYDDFSPRELPDGKLVFISTRRGGYHRCGRGPCDVYTLAQAEADGSGAHPVSFHETNEWDPAVLDDGRVIYTRWDYVDRNAVHYQQLWTTRTDASNPVAYYGNNTWNPVGVWEARQVPGSPLVMATAAAHHAMTAGSIILVDRARGVDGPDPLRRLTPDAMFPESETLVEPQKWHAPGSPKEVTPSEEEKRWPSHCYKSPYPLSEEFFIAAYSFDPLIGEPAADKANMFGLYAADVFGNRELIYRDLNFSSLWPAPLRSRPRPTTLPPTRDDSLADDGVYYLQNVYAGKYGLPPGSVKRLRVVQVLPKTTWNANDPMVGLAFASPGKQVLGTAPVEADGSAFFRVPSRTPFCFQALDERGRAIQMMRSVTYVQPGEKASCVGCHEGRLAAPASAGSTIASRRPPSTLEPGPDGSRPFSYPLLVQPVLDKYCVKCHSGEKPAGPEGNPIVLTGEPDGHYTKSYNALAPRVPFSAWGVYAGASEGDGFGNGEPETKPDRFGARASRLMDMLLQGHHEVNLNNEEVDRLVTWMDANALFYGTFEPQAQARQQSGERIEGPALN